MSKLLELLQAEDVEGFNSTRTMRGRPDLFAADLAGKSLVGVDLSSANLEKADLDGTDLTDATLVSADLSGIDGSDLNLDGAMGIKMRMRDSWCERIDLTGAELTRANLSGAHMTEAKGEFVRLCNAKLKSANFTKAVMPEADLSEASMHQADFTGADLRRGSMTEARGAAAIFAGAKLDGVVATNAKFAEAVFEGASMVGVRFDGVDLNGANLKGADLSAADLTRANLKGADLAGANLSGACLADASVEDCDFSEVTLDQADLTGLDPAMLGLSEAQIEGLASYGAVFDPDAQLVIEKAAMARSGDTVVALWTNPDGESVKSMRWGMLRGGVEVASGVLPISAEGSVSESVVGTATGFDLLVLTDRPDGVVLVQIQLDFDGAIVGNKTHLLRYPPAVAPLFEVRDGQIWSWGLTSRTPTVVVQRLGDEGLELVHSERVPTARGFLGRHQPVLACKGDVAMSVGLQSVGQPARTPDGFPGTLGVVIPDGDKLQAIWYRAPVGQRVEGGVFAATMGGRRGGEPTMLAQLDRLIDLDAMSIGERVVIAWIEGGAGVLDTSVRVFDVTQGAAHVIRPKGGPVRRVRLLRGPAGEMALALHTMDDALLVVELDGTVIGSLGG